MAPEFLRHNDVTPLQANLYSQGPRPFGRGPCFAYETSIQRQSPLPPGQELGHLTVLVDGQAVEEIPLVAQEAVGKRSLWQVYGGLLAALFCGAGEAGF